MTTLEKKAIPGQAQISGQNLSDASLDNINGGVFAPEEDVPVMDGSNVRPDSPEISDALDQLKTMEDAKKKIERDL